MAEDQKRHGKECDLKSLNVLITIIFYSREVSD